MRLSFLLLFIVISFSCFGQNTYQINGYVTDSLSGEVLIGAYVYVTINGKLTGLATNKYGFYTLSVKEGAIPLNASMLGYHTFQETLNVTKDQTLNIRLHPKEYFLKEVAVEDKRDTSIFSNDLNFISISGKTLLKTPRFAGEADAMKTLQFLPGIKQGSEGSAGLHVRGGSPDQNLILLDGVPVYNIYHAFGYLSVFNTEAIKDVRVYKSGISSRYEGRLSSVIDITLKEGNKYSAKKSFTMSPVSGSFLWEGPIKKEKSSFILTGRRTWMDVLFKLANAGKDNSKGYNFYDISGKFNFLLNNKNSAFVSFYSSGDKFYDRLNDGSTKSEFGFKWGNHTLLGRHNYQISPKTFLSNLVFFSRYHFHQKDLYKTSTSTQEREITSYIQDINLRSQIEHFPNNQHKLTGGVELGLREFRPELVHIVSGETEIGTKSVAQTFTKSLNFFLEDFITFSGFELLLSSRQSLYSVGGRNYFHIQPHALLSYQIQRNWKVKAAYDELVQYLHLLTNSTMGQPTDLWVPATEQVAPQRSRQFSVGTEYQTPDKRYSFSIDGYLKEMKNVIEYKEGANYLYGIDESWEEKVAIGKGTAKGIEFLAKKNSGKFNGWFAYTLANSTRQFEEINNGEKFPYKYDRTHDLSVVGIYDFNKKNQFSAAFTYNTGNALTLPVATIQHPVPSFAQFGGASKIKEFLSSQPLYTSRNNFRMPAYHRLDLSYHHTKQTKKRRTRTWIISVYNTYNKLNPYFIYEKDGKIRQYAFFPIVPSVAYKLEF